MRTSRLASLACLALGLSLTVGCGDSTGSGGSGNGGEAAGGEGQGGTPVGEEVNGCTRAAATDMTGMTDITLTWTLTHQQCIVVDAGTRVTWEGDFTTHPLSGGESPTEEAGPITSTDQSGTTASVTFASAGEFPYFCGIHFSSMQGVIYVE